MTCQVPFFSKENMKFNVIRLINEILMQIIIVTIKYGMYMQSSVTKSITNNVFQVTLIVSEKQQNDGKHVELRENNMKIS
ncbi:hypothetical protein V1477_009110 [Vespula maculifrons]|uniref:Uncharacterized protein n=1 Tax=Vespula maculifrons TaxID=7453 RepID=A0ABD2CEX5_VESMC